jgi:hypothetical protein
MPAPRASDTDRASDPRHTAADEEARGDAESSITPEGDNEENNGAPIRDSWSQIPQLKFTRFPVYRRRSMRGWHNGRG